MNGLGMPTEFVSNHPEGSRAPLCANMGETLA